MKELMFHCIAVMRLQHGCFVQAEANTSVQPFMSSREYVLEVKLELSVSINQDQYSERSCLWGCCVVS